MNAYTGTMRFQVCTIIAHNYLAQARVLYRSFRQFHPDIPFSVLVFDAPRGTVEEEWDSFGLADLGLPPGEETRMPAFYNVTELATALKPWFFRQLLERQKLDLLYFDPDIEIFSPVDRIAALAHAHSLVVTPHTTRPMSRDKVRPSETDILSAGVYNLGFLGLNCASTDFLDWWGERLLREAIIDPTKMRFTDQRWIDFTPGYFDTHILKDETCNVAYWNADVRPLTWTGERYEVRGEPLCFFHFSGFKPENPSVLSIYQGENPRSSLAGDPVLQGLCQAYVAKLNAAGYEEMRNISYGFNRLATGVRFEEPMRLAYREALRRHEEEGSPLPPNPFAQPEEFVAWFNGLLAIKMPSDSENTPVTSRIKDSLARARRKTFVKNVKPLRRLFRNQGAVNDSLIEAVHHLAAQNQELIKEMSELREMIDNLRDPPAPVVPPRHASCGTSSDEQ